MSGARPPWWDFYADRPASPSPTWSVPVDGTAMIGARPGDEMARPPIDQATGAEIAIINRVKAKAEEVRALLVEVQSHNGSNVDPRWLAIGKTDLQKGFMAVILAVARPETF